MRVFFEKISDGQLHQGHTFQSQGVTLDHLDLPDLKEIQFNGGLASEHGDHDLHTTTLSIHFAHTSLKLLEWAVGDDH